MANNRFVVGCTVHETAVAFSKYYHNDWGVDETSVKRFNDFVERHNGCGTDFSGNHIFVDREIDSKYEWRYEHMKWVEK